MISLAIIVVLSYLVGSIPSAILVSKRVFGFDIRERGSGNMGSTNAIRILGWKWGLLVQTADIMKGVIPVVIIANLLGQDIKIGSGEFFEHITVVRMFAGVSAIAGHVWSVFAGFRGGKGINTTAGVLIAIAPIDVFISIGIFIIAVLLSGYISLGSISAAVTVPLSMVFRYNILNDYIPGYQVLLFFSIGIALLILYTHRSNIKRLLKGTENRFSKLQVIKCKSKGST
ncbi:MAG: glycerol-3-phosphate 1-O-acyltransferase [Bacteroidetes bacterium]|nr:MAG: glycerol-3-phosphate 1-O-acyltransferase [Bacteroidota bacterium]